MDSKASSIGKIKVRTNLFAPPKAKREKIEDSQQQTTDDAPEHKASPICKIRVRSNLYTSPVEDMTECTQKKTTESDSEQKASPICKIRVRSNLYASPIEDMTECTQKKTTESDSEQKASPICKIRVRSNLYASPVEDMTECTQKKTTESDSEQKAFPIGKIKVRSNLFALPKEATIVEQTTDDAAPEQEVDEQSIPGCSSSSGCSSDVKIQEKSEEVYDEESQFDEDYLPDDVLTQNDWCNYDAPLDEIDNVGQDPDNATTSFQENIEPQGYDESLHTTDVSIAGPSGTNTNRMRKRPTTFHYEIDESKACHMSFSRFSYNLVVAFPEFIKFYKICASHNGFINIVELGMVATSLTHEISRLSYGILETDISAIAGMQLLRVPGNWELKKTFNLPGISTAIDVDSTSTYVIIGTEDGSVLAVELDTGRIEFDIIVSETPIRSVVVETPLIYGIAEDRTFVIDITTETVQFSMLSHCKLKCAIVQNLFLIAGNADGEIIFRDLCNIVYKYTHTIGKSKISSLASIGEADFAVGSEDGVIRLYSTIPFAEIGWFATLFSPVLALSGSFDSKWLLTNDEDSCKLFPLPDLPQKAKRVPGFPMPCMDMSAVVIKQEPEETDDDSYDYS